MYLKLVCCIHFVEKLTELRIDHELNSYFHSLHQENHEVVVVKCETCIRRCPSSYYNNHLRNRTCFCNDMGRFDKCSTCRTVCKVTNTVAVKVCVKKEQFPTGQNYFCIDKYLEDLTDAGFFIYSKQHNFVYYRIDHPES